MKTPYHQLRSWALVAASVTIIACGGGGGSPSAGIDRGGVRTPVQISGSITGFGSVIVRGAAYGTSAATVIVDGSPGAEAELGVGQIIRLAGELDGTNQTATRIELAHDIVGPVDSIDLAGTIIVLGQTVRLDPVTSFASDIPTRSLAGLAQGDVIAISGFHAADGSLLAGRIERAAPGTPARVRGFVQSVDTAQRELRINALLVDYASATVEAFPSGAPSVGDYVEVSGTAVGNSELRAAQLRRERRSPLDTAAGTFRATVEGLITRYASTSDFDVDGQAAVLAPAAVLQNGTTAELRLNARVTATGTVNAAGVLSVETLLFAPATTIRIQAPVSAVDAAAGTVTVLGTTVRVAADTYVEDLTDGERIFTLGDIVVGDWLEIQGYEDPANANRMIATRLARDNDDTDDIELVGPVKSLQDPEFSILAIRVLTNSLTEFDDIDRDAFFAGPPGLVVDVEGALVGNLVVAEEVEGD